MVTNSSHPLKAEQSGRSYVYTSPCVTGSIKTEGTRELPKKSSLKPPQTSPSLQLPPAVYRQERIMGIRDVPSQVIQHEQRVDDVVSQLDDSSARDDSSQALVDEIINNLSGLWQRRDEMFEESENDESSTMSGSTASSRTELTDPSHENKALTSKPQPQREEDTQTRTGFSILQAGLRALSPTKARVAPPPSESDFSAVNCLLPSNSGTLSIAESKHRALLRSSLPRTTSSKSEVFVSVEAILANMKSVEVKLNELEQQQRETKSQGEIVSTRDTSVLSSNSYQRLRSQSQLSTVAPSTNKSKKSPESPPGAEGCFSNTSATIPMSHSSEHSISLPSNLSFKTTTLESVTGGTELVIGDADELQPPSFKNRLRTVACWSAKKSMDSENFYQVASGAKTKARSWVSPLARGKCGAAETKNLDATVMGKTRTNPAVSETTANLSIAGNSRQRSATSRPSFERPKMIAGSNPMNNATDASQAVRSQLRIAPDDKPSTLSTIISSVQSSLSFSSSVDQLFESTRAAESHTSYPVMRIVSDGSSDTKLLVQGSRDFLIGAPDVMFTPTSGNRQSIILYEYDTGNHMGVMYEEFGDDPRSLLRVEEFDGVPQPKESLDEVLIKVEASTVSRSDCAIRQGEWWRTSNIPLPNIPGVDLVGRIHYIDKRTANKFNLREGDRVTALTRWGGNSRFACVPAKLLVKVPGNLDPGKTVCLVETYLSAFQAIHHGQPESARYSKESLRGKTILVVEGYTNVGLAAIKLAMNAGAVVYTTAKEKHFQEITKVGAIPLTKDPLDWLPLVGERMDIVVAVGGVYSDTEEPANHYHLRALRSGGDLVLIGDPGDQWIPKVMSKTGSLGCLVGISKAYGVSTHKYCVFEQWADDIEGSKRDLEHLLKLLQSGLFNPKVIDRVPLSRVPKAQELIQDKSHNGIIVCEPWIRSKHRSVLL